jgi:hypothetical protein
MGDALRYLSVRMLVMIACASGMLAFSGPSPAIAAPILAPGSHNPRPHRSRADSRGWDAYSSSCPYRRANVGPRSRSCSDPDADAGSL